MSNHAGKFVTATAAALMMMSSQASAQSADWLKQVSRIVAAKQTYPSAAQMRGDEGTAKVKLYVGADGTIEKTEMVSPTGSSVLDREALAAPARAGRLPAPPGGATTIVVPLTWKLL